MPLRFLDLGEVLAIHEDQIRRYGGHPGVRDFTLLHSAISMPQVGAHGHYAHDTLFAMAAAYLFHLVRNHPFIDGNKRTATAAALVFLALNGLHVSCADDALVALVEDVSEGRVDKARITAWLEAHAAA